MQAFESHQDTEEHWLDVDHASTHIRVSVVDEQTLTTLSTLLTKDDAETLLVWLIGVVPHLKR